MNPEAFKAATEAERKIWGKAEKMLTRALGCEQQNIDDHSSAATTPFTEWTNCAFKLPMPRVGVRGAFREGIEY